MAAIPRVVEVVPPQRWFPAGSSVEQVIPDVDLGIDAKEVIASWNVQPTIDAKIKVEVCAHVLDRKTSWYTMADWNLHEAATRRTVNGQKDDDGKVSTDTLVLNRPARKFDVRITVTTGAAGAEVSLLTLAGSNGINPEPAPSRVGLGKVIEVPQKCQGNYPKGNVICSPTSTTMILNHWSIILNRMDLNVDVPETTEAVWDAAYNGGGNWPFNTAFAGSFQGMRAYVTRLSSINDLQEWTSRGFPVACSVASSVLYGKMLDPKEQGHLVVLVGFAENGDPIFNDPAWKSGVRKTFKRADFDKAWNHSDHTVYLIYPKSMTPPPSQGSWLP